MAGAGSSSLTAPPRLIGASKYTAFKFLRHKLSGEAPFTARIPTTNSNHHGGFSTCCVRHPPCPVVSEGPSCIFVGPIETASQETLEALYRQEDPSQVFALASVWFLILVFGGSVCLLPILYTVSLAYQDTFNSEAVDIGQSSTMEFLAMLNYVLFMLLGSVIGCPIASASARALQGLWRNDLVALKGACPNCGEEVFAFVRSNQSNGLPHRANCHVCECLLEFRTKAEQSISKLGRRWVHGRVYLISERRSRQHQTWR